MKKYNLTIIYDVDVTVTEIVDEQVLVLVRKITKHIPELRKIYGTGEVLDDEEVVEFFNKSGVNSEDINAFMEKFAPGYIREEYYMEEQLLQLIIKVSYYPLDIATILYEE